MSHSTTNPHVDGWQLETDSAEAYERYLVPALMDEGARRLVESSAPRAGERALDVGCGTGIVARRAAAAVGSQGRVVGIDVNEDMLRVARRIGSSAAPSIEWRQGHATALPFPERAFDVVLSQQMLQFVPEPERAVREMRRVLSPGGRLAIGVCRPIEFAAGYVPLAEALKRHAGEGAETMMRSPFPAWSVERVREIVRAGGFGEVAVRIDLMTVRYPSAAEFLRREAACSPLAGPLGSMSAESRTALVRDLEGALRSRMDDEGLVLPLEVYVVRARG